MDPWPLLHSKPGGDYRVFRVRLDRKRSPRNQRELDFSIIECANWVNVIALTPNQELVMVEQFRHGTNTVELEIPGGMIDPKDPSPEHAGSRELREETGFTGDPPTLIGQIHPNPAIMTNTCYTVLVRNCTLTHPTEWDHGEDIRTTLIPRSDLHRLVTSGRIRHSLVALAIFYLDLALPA